MPAPGVCLNILEARHKQDGFGMIGNPTRIFNQDYKDLKQYCLIRGVRYIDDMFPPERRSIGDGILKPSDVARIVWLRPGVSVWAASEHKGDQLSIQVSFLSYKATYI